MTRTMREQVERIEALNNITVKVLDDNGEFEYTGLTIFDPDVGLTIVDNEDHDTYLFCIRGPSSPESTKYLKPNDKRWELALEIIVPMLESGTFDLDEFGRRIREALHMGPPSLLSIILEQGPTSETCPFGQ